MTEPEFDTSDGPQSQPSPAPAYMSECEAEEPEPCSCEESVALRARIAELESQARIDGISLHTATQLCHEQERDLAAANAQMGGLNGLNKSLCAENEKHLTRIAELESQLKAANLDADFNGRDRDAANARADAAERAHYAETEALGKVSAALTAERAETERLRSTVRVLTLEVAELRAARDSSARARGEP